MKMKMIVPTPDDIRDSYHSTSFLVKYTPQLSDFQRKRVHRHMNERGEVQINVSAIHLTHNDKEDPMLAQVKNQINRYFFPHTRLNQRSFLRGFGDSYQEILFTRKYPDGNFTFFMTMDFNNRGTASYKLNSKSLSREIVHTVLAKMLLKMCFATSSSAMREYLNMLLHVPPRVVHALENRTVYKFYVDGRRIEVRLNTKRISEKECALEISDSLWLPISNKDLDSFIKYHREDNQRNKKWNVAPINLIRMLDENTYSKMAESTQNVMNAFLMQNRTQKLVEKRAQKLLSEMTEKFPTRLFTYKERVDYQEKMATAMLVSGELADYFIVPNRSQNHGHQNVSVFVVHGPNTTHGDGFTRKDYATRGPVCIDNIHNNSSIGDQIMSRALALMNDKAAVNAIHTLRTNLPPEPYRVDRKKLRGDSE